MSDFVHLHCHSEYSLLDGLSRIRDMVHRARELGMSALALTDHGALYGAIDFYVTAKAAGLKPIIGVETYVARRSRLERDPRLDAKPYHLVLLAKDFEGYRNLVQLVTAAHLEGYYYRPRIDKDILRERARGLVALSACLQGEVATAIRAGDLDGACAAAREYEDVLGKGNFFLEVMNHGLAEEAAVRQGLRAVSTRTGIPLVATNDFHYVAREDAEAQDILACIQTGKTVETPDRLRMIDTPEYYLKTADEMAALFPEEAEAIANTTRIADMVDLHLPLSELRLPNFPVPRGETPDSYLRALAEEGLRGRYVTPTGELRARLDYELEVVSRMNYAAYILIVQDFLRFARERGILTAVRGSAGGSLVNYCVGVTDVDPISYGLVFDRFLNLARFTQPDIDVDFMDSRRDEVIQYVTQKYGADHVAQIVTFNTMLARAAVRDVARVLSMPYGEADRVAKTIPFGMSLEDARRELAELRELERQPHIVRLLDLAEKVEGLVRSTGTHAAGVVITPDPLTELVPLERTKGTEGVQTQFEDKQIEKLGLLKFDFLGLANLTILDRAMKTIERTRGIRIDRGSIPLDDQKTFELLSSGETTGLFQLESAGMRRYVRDLKPNRVEDIMAMVALFRPGPMSNIPAYIRRKRGLEPITVPHPLLEPVLRETYGVMVYQEDVMAVVQALADYSAAEADVLCYAIRKKIKEKLDAQHEAFVRGARQKGVADSTIERVWEDFTPFARYGFNRAHAAIYGLIAYHTAYLKANYPVEYMTAVLSAEMGRPERVATAVAECRRMEIEVRPPDLNRSQFEFTIEDDPAPAQSPSAASEASSRAESGPPPTGPGAAVRFGLGGVKNVGEGAVEAIVSARGDRPYRSLEDLCARVDLQRVNKRVLESLTKCGALDALGPRGAQLARIESALDTAQREQRDRESGQVALFDLVDHAASAPLAAAAGAASRKEQLGWEKELLGLYLSEHPLQEIQGRVGDVVTHYLSELAEAGSDQVIVAGVIAYARRHVTKNKQLMVFAQLEDLTGSVEVTVFPRVYEATASVWNADNVVLVLGRVEEREESPKLLADHAVVFSETAAAEIRAAQSERRGWRRRNGGRDGNGSGDAAMPDTPPPVPVIEPPRSELVLRFQRVLDYDESIAVFQRVQQVLASYPGDARVVLLLPDRRGGARRVPTSFRANPCPELSRDVVAALGEDVLRIDERV